MVHTAGERVVYRAYEVIFADLMTSQSSIEIPGRLLEGSQLFTKVDSFGVHNNV
jgi:hypothetical protein